jgi:hypothetical protein
MQLNVDAANPLPACSSARHYAELAPYDRCGLSRIGERGIVRPCELSCERGGRCAARPRDNADVIASGDRRDKAGALVGQAFDLALEPREMPQSLAAKFAHSTVVRDCVRDCPRVPILDHCRLLLGR